MAKECVFCFAFERDIFLMPGVVSSALAAKYICSGDRRDSAGTVPLQVRAAHSCGVLLMNSTGSLKTMCDSNITRSWPGPLES